MNKKHSNTNFKVNNFWKLWLKYWSENKTLSFICIITILLVSLLSVFNIFIAKELTALLISDTFVKNINDKSLIYKFLEQYADDPVMYQILKDMLQSKISNGFDDAFINTLLHDQYFTTVFYESGTLYTQFLSLHLDKMEWIIILVSCIGGVILFMYIAYTLCGIIAENVQKKLNNQLINNIFNKPVSYFQENKHEEVISKITKDSHEIVTQLKIIPIIILYIFFSTVVSISMLVIIDAKITLYMGIMLAAFLLIAILIIVLIAKPMKENLKKKKNLDNSISEKIFAIRLVKSNGNTDSEINNFEKQIAVQAKNNKQSNFLISMVPAIIIGAIGSLALASIVVGIFVLVTLIFQLNTILQGINDTNVAVASILTLLTTDKKGDVEKEKPNFKNINSIEKISFDKITLKHKGDDKNIFKDISFEVEKGKKYALVGESGCGKSTIVKMLLDFFQPTSGSIKVNDLEFSNIDKKVWLDKIGYVDQEPEILSGTFIENLRYVVPNASDEEIIEAYKKANLHEYISSLKDIYNTVLFERGKQLSGGQKQRLVIARLFLKKPELIILDEATSALDNIVEKEIQKELNELSQGRTVIAIAHRLSTIKDFDKILVLKNQKIVERGTFDKLIQNQSYFKEMYQMNK